MKYKNSSQSYQAFTLVELIIVITILGVLSVIGFLYFREYLSLSRDTKRVTTISTIGKGLDTTQVKTGSYPKPDSFFEILGNNEIMSYQGFVGENVSKIIGIRTPPKDPSLEELYIYSIDKTQSNYQIMGYFENIAE